MLNATFKGLKTLLPFSEVIRRPNGSSQVTAVRMPSLPAITSRLRAKSLSENSSGIGPSPSSSVMQMNN
jgi:hypothetical protein